MPPGAYSPVVPTGRQTVQVPILMYHYIRVPPDPGSDHLGWGLSTSPDDFRQQMDYLDSNGFHPITLTQLRAYLAGNHSLPDKPVVLTFDDGYTDVYTQAFPVLKQHHFTGVAYIVSGFVGRSGSNVMPEQVREMDAYGIEIGAHTVSHADLTKAGGTLAAEVGGSKAALEALVGHPVLDFCYPAGRYDAAVVQAVFAAGFESATTTQPGTVHSLDDRFTWTRVRVSGGETLADYADNLRAHETGVAPTQVRPIQIPRSDP
ncbi:MAG: polysaccharide deacetylase family protein, partial [Candidatus Dormibacteraeota bacterium]|nr:polysaccharide deacetylase family protein [Candidatus Dormibacteraeota bacterium]